MTSSSKGNIVKILVIGDHNTGKTSIVRRYVYKQFEEYTLEATIGMDIASKKVRVDNMTLKVQLWDIAGQDRFIGLAPTYYRHAVAAVVVFDITNANTLKNAQKWKLDVDDKVFLSNEENIPVILFANKWDLVENNPKQRKVSDEELDNFCHKNNFIGWFSTSAKTSLNIRKGMNFMINRIIENKKRLESDNNKFAKTNNIDMNNNNNNNNTIDLNQSSNPQPQNDQCISCGLSKESNNVRS